MPTPRRRAAPRAALLLLIAALTSCASPHTSHHRAAHKRHGVPTTHATTTTTAVEATTTTTTAQTPEQQVTAAYLASNLAFYRALATPDAAHEELSTTTTGPSLTLVRDLLARRAHQGIEVQFPKGFPQATTRQVAVIGNRATLLACTLDDSIQVMAATGAIVNATVESMLDHVDLVRSSGTWRVAQVNAVGRWLDSNGCRQ